MGDSPDEAKWKEIVNRVSQQGHPKKSSPKPKKLDLVTTAIAVIAGRATITGALLLGVQWFLSQAYPHVAALRGTMPFWVAFLGGMLVNLLYAAITSSNNPS